MDSSYFHEFLDKIYAAVMYDFHGKLIVDADLLGPFLLIITLPRRLFELDPVPGCSNTILASRWS